MNRTDKGGIALYNLFDSHVHSDNSSDATHSVTFLCERAAAIGLSGFCICDHCELHEYEQGQYETRLAQAMFDVTRCQSIFRGRLVLSGGVELSDTLVDPAFTDEIIARFPFDMVMISHHNLADGTDIFYINFGEWSSAELNRYLDYYFDSLAQIAQASKYDVLGHLTYPLRYICGNHGVKIDLGRWDDQIEETLRLTAQNGKAIEVNASGLFGALEDTMPPFRYLKRYRELGGEFVTLGSDAHAAEQLGQGIDVSMQLLTDAGFDHFTFYKQRQPLQLKIL